MRIANPTPTSRIGKVGNVGKEVADPANVTESREPRPFRPRRPRTNAATDVAEILRTAYDLYCRDRETQVAIRHVLR